jgi:hypothetical protein
VDIGRKGDKSQLHDDRVLKYHFVVDVFEVNISMVIAVPQIVME